MEDVSECEFEEEFDEAHYQDSLPEMDAIVAHSENDKTAAVLIQQEKRGAAMVMAMDGGYESGGDVSEGEIEALEIPSSSLAIAQHTFRQ
jgi:hypothetical protein